jgi:predicted site-specific integrase-resolvase
MTVQSDSTTSPENPGGFNSEAEILPLVGVSRRTLKKWRERGLIAYVKLPGSRRILYSWESVRSALLRAQKNTE